MRRQFITQNSVAISITPGIRERKTRNHSFARHQRWHDTHSGTAWNRSHQATTNLPKLPRSLLEPQKHPRKAIAVKAAPAKTSVPTSQEVFRFIASYDGTLWHYPEGQAEITALEIQIPQNTTLSSHWHPMPNIGIVKAGSITLVNEATQKRVTYTAGQYIPEMVNTIHHGETMSEPCELLVIYFGVVGQKLSEKPEANVQGPLHMTEDEITRILGLNDIGKIVQIFQKRCAALGGTENNIEQEFVAVRELIESDLQARLSRDPAVHSEIDFVLRDKAFQALLLYRVSHALWSPQYIQYTPEEAHNARCVALKLHNLAKGYRIEIHPGAEIGKALYLDHAIETRILNGVVLGEDCGILDGVFIGAAPLPILIGEQSIIGSQCTIGGEVVLGAYFPRETMPEHVLETEQERSRRHPKIGDRVCICRGTKIFGPVTVGNDVLIFPHSTVTQDIPNSTRFKN